MAAQNTSPRRRDIQCEQLRRTQGEATGPGPAFYSPTLLPGLSGRHGHPDAALHRCSAATRSVPAALPLVPGCSASSSRSPARQATSSFAAVAGRQRPAAQLVGGEVDLACAALVARAMGGDRARFMKMLRRLRREFAASVRDLEWLAGRRRRRPMAFGPTVIRAAPGLATRRSPAPRYGRPSLGPDGTPQELVVLGISARRRGAHLSSDIDLVFSILSTARPALRLPTRSTSPALGQALIRLLMRRRSTASCSASMPAALGDSGAAGGEFRAFEDYLQQHVAATGSAAW